MRFYYLFIFGIFLAPNVLAEPTFVIHGVVKFHPQKSLHLHAPYQGIVRQVNKSIGDQVKPGETLAVIENQVGLQSYPLISTIQGSVVARNISVGQSIGPDTEAFVVADPKEVIGLFRVPLKDEAQIKEGYILKLISDQKIEGKIFFVSPILDEHSRSIIVHGLFSNLDSRLREGQLISAEVNKGQ